ncbi:UNVERIFIED_CONTAM: protein kinase, partial [Salmonella enterica subsp. enterica serovar Weltevreden]
KVPDFGLALNVAKQNDKDSTFIMGVGSPAYMSPEQVKGYPLNQKTDLYSLGVVLFHLLTGRLPFRAKHPAQLIYKII